MSLRSLEIAKHSAAGKVLRPWPLHHSNSSAQEQALLSVSHCATLPQRSTATPAPSSSSLDHPSTQRCHNSRAPWRNREHRPLRSVPRSWKAKSVYPRATKGLAAAELRTILGRTLKTTSFSHRTLSNGFPCRRATSLMLLMARSRSCERYGIRRTCRVPSGAYTKPASSTDGTLDSSSLWVTLSSTMLRSTPNRSSRMSSSRSASLVLSQLPLSKIEMYIF